MLTAFYLKHEPANVARVDEILGAYTPSELDQALRNKYGEVPNDLSTAQPASRESFDSHSFRRLNVESALQALLKWMLSQCSWLSWL